MTNPDRWATPRIREAMAKLEEAEVGLDQQIADAKQLQRQIPSSGLSQQDIEQIEQHARGKDAPKELRELQARIDRGELSWGNIAAGEALDDPQVRKALAGGVAGMRQAYAMIQEGHDLDDIIDAGGPPVQIGEDDEEGHGDSRTDDGADDDFPDDEYYDRSTYDR